MKKVYAKVQLEEALDKIKRLTTGERTYIYHRPIVPSDCCSFDSATADYIRDRINLYVKSWIIPNIENAIKELSR